MNTSFPKILIVSYNSLLSTNANGRTLINLLKKWDSNSIAQLYMSSDYPDYDKCIRISTTSAIKGMILPGVLIILCPIVVTLLFGSNMLIGLLVGILLSSILLGISQSNSGGAWDNAKKSFEHGVMIEGENQEEINSDANKIAQLIETKLN